MYIYNEKPKSWSTLGTVCATMMGFISGAVVMDIRTGECVIPPIQVTIQQKDIAEAALLNNVKVNNSGYTLDSVYWLAKNIYFEARSETVEGQYAVALTTMARVGSNKFPDTVEGVVTEAKLDENGEPVLNRCQFSWYCDGKEDEIKNQKSWDASIAIAFHTLQGDALIPFSGADTATFYHADYVSPNWKNVVEIGKVDSHIFYAGADSRL